MGRKTECRLGQNLPVGRTGVFASGTASTTCRAAHSANGGRAAEENGVGQVLGSHGTVCTEDKHREELTQKPDTGVRHRGHSHPEPGSPSFTALAAPELRLLLLRGPEPGSHSLLFFIFFKYIF